MLYRIALITSLVLITAAILSTLPPSPHWKRPNPLINPTKVVAVNNGALTLIDGRKLIPIGITRSEQIDQATYDQFLTAATAQGIIIERVTTDARAYIRVEPKFYNSCGTSKRRSGWQGAYAQCPLSELAIYCNYAQPDTNQSQLTPPETWRLRGTTSLRCDDEPHRLSGKGDALRYDGAVSLLKDLDTCIELMTDTPRP